VFGIAFALRGTLVDDRGLTRASLETLAAEVVAEYAPARAELSAAAVADRLLAAGPLAAAGVGAALAELVPAAPAKTAAGAFSARYRQISASLVPAFLTPRQGALETLAEIARLAIPSAILTNAPASVAFRAAAELGFAGRVLAAEDIGCEKPDADAYAAPAGAFGLPADAIYYVGADPFDIAAARAAGLTTVFLSDAAGARPSAATAAAHTIESLPALLPLLAEPYTRGMLALRYVAHTALAWRPGHFVPGGEYGRRMLDDDA